MDGRDKKDILIENIENARTMYEPTKREFEKTLEVFSAMKDWEWNVGLKKCPSRALVKEIYDRLLDGDVLSEQIKQIAKGVTKWDITI